MIRVDLLGLGFAGSELLLAWRRRSRRAGAESRDAGTFALAWVVIGGAAVCAFAVARRVRWGTFDPRPWQPLLLTLFLGGLALRWWAILVLGRFFTVDVAIHHDHRLVTSGPYRVVRHPSYTGILLAFSGMTLLFGSALALAVLLVPLILVFLRRLQVEERALAERFGDEWRTYRERTWRLVPFVW